NCQTAGAPRLSRGINIEFGEGREKLSEKVSPSPNPTSPSSKIFVFIESLFTGFPVRPELYRDFFIFYNL
ncbi:hypothetical protein, partial [Bilophila wadsworthia]|uniref:hypothetical protein n=1 Tax=Bilophila wadsworthia TaxID=35833 RepID=UPI002671D11E